MKKVLMIGMNADKGGIETYIMNLYRHLDKEYVLYFPYVENIAYQDELEALGGKFIYGVPISRRNPFTYYKAWNNAFKEYQFDAVYFNNCDIINLDILKIAKNRGIPIRIFHAHNSSNTLSTSTLHRLEEKHNRKITEKVITHKLACSDNAGEHIFRGYSYQVIQNGIDVDRFRFDKEVRRRKREKLHLPNTAKVILFVGRFTEIKNPLYAMDVMKACYEKDNRFIGLLCGDGPIVEQVQNKWNEEQLQPCVRLLGNRNDINEIYSAADFLIMPSLFEGFPFVLVEAQCSGLKCICSDKVETNTNLNGTVEYLPLELEPDGWAERIVKLPIDYDRTGGKDVIRKAGFDIEQTVQVIKDIFEGKE